MQKNNNGWLLKVFPFVSYLGKTKSIVVTTILLLVLFITLKSIIFFTFFNKSISNLTKQNYKEETITLTDKILESISFVNNDYTFSNQLLNEKAVSIIPDLDELQIQLKKISKYNQSKNLSTYQQHISKLSIQLKQVKVNTSTENKRKILILLYADLNQIRQSIKADIKVENKLFIKLFKVTSNKLLFFNFFLLIGVLFLVYKLIISGNKINRLYFAVNEKNHELLKRKSELEHVTHVISHDFRSPLYNIKTLSTIIQQEPDVIEKNNMVKLVEESSDRLYQKSEDLLLLLKYESGISNNMSNVNLLEILKNVKYLFNLSIEKSQPIIETDFKVKTVYFSQTYMESIFQNMISNSLKYHFPERKIVIKIRSFLKDSNIILEFSDNGLGIDLEKHRHEVFGMFKTFHNHQDSNGLGLYLVKKQIEEMRGTIKVSSVVNQGTTFTIEIPSKF